MVDTSRKQQQAQKAELRVGSGPAEVRVKAEVTPSGLLATGGLVGAILLSATALVWAATSVKREHPITSMLGRR